MLEIPKNNLFKWIGGKTWLSEEIINILNENINKETKIKNYIEPFIGGLGSFKIILPKLIENKIEKIILNDINKSIITTFQNIQKNSKEVEKELEILYKKYNDTFPKEKIKSKKKIKEIEIEDYYYYYELQKTKDKKELKEKFLKEPENFFKKIRTEFNELKKQNQFNIKTTVFFLFLMDTCFNGIYRENGKGEYNVPFNWTNKKLNIENKIKIIKEYNKIFNEIEIIFENMDVFELLKKYNKYNKSTLIYLDPPYLNKNGGENKYDKEEFDKNKQIKLIKEIKKIEKVLYSNHYVEELLKELEKKAIKKVIKKVYRRNIISSSKENRNQKIEEMLTLITY